VEAVRSPLVSTGVPGDSYSRLLTVLNRMKLMELAMAVFVSELINESRVIFFTKTYIQIR